jgi:hypothetical protein
MITDASETLLQQRLNPGPGPVHPDQPFPAGTKARLVPRGEYHSVSDKWLK